MALEKTTCAKSLASQLSARLILEEFENNPFLPQFYSNKDRYAFQVELFFLAERYHQLSKNLLGDIFNEYTVYDYHFSKSAIFSKINLREDEHLLFQNLFRIMDRFMPKPDILIYIHMSVNQILSQIKKRGRTFEELISSDYLQAVQTSYFSFFREETSFPIVVLELNQTETNTPEKVLSYVNDVLSKKWPHGLSFNHY